MPPWTPVKKISGGFAVWGRDYIFKNGIFPVQIINQKRPEFTTAPTLKFNGINLATIPAVESKLSKDHVELRGKTDIDGFTISTRTKLEFDGCLRYDFEITPKSNKTVKQLELTLPFNMYDPAFLHFSNGMSGNVEPVSAKKILPFTPFIWLGNYDQGVCVFAESDQYWFPADRRDCIEIVKKAGRIELRLKYIVRPQQINTPIKFTVGIMATPVKPIGQHDLFKYTKWLSRNERVSLPENLDYGTVKGINSEQGCLEFFIKRNKAEGKTDVFVANDGKKQLVCRINKGIMYVAFNRKRLLTSSKKDFSSKFVHVALSWLNNKLRLFINGKQQAEVPMTDKLSKFFGSLGDPKGQLMFGGSYFYALCDAAVDEIRLSSKARYSSAFEPPVQAFKHDSNTLVLDHLNESFKPDGFDTYTATGGLPSIGGKFVPGRFGQGLLMLTVPTTRDKIYKRIGNKVYMTWSWSPEWLPTLMTFELKKDAVRMVKQAKKDGGLAIPYFMFPAIREPSGLASQFGAEWQISPKKSMKVVGRNVLFVSSAAQGYADYLAAGTKWILDKKGFRGLYTDGAGNVSASCNQAYEAGYVGTDGKRRTTYPIFGTRETMKRMYKIVKQKNPDNIVANHASFAIDIPIMSFSDIYYTGEHEDYSHLPTSQIRFRGEPWGIYCKLLGPSSHKWSPFHMMISLLHGTEIWGYTVTGRNDMYRKHISIQEAYQKFGYKSAEWIPYFKGKNFYSTLDAKIKVSMYLHKGKDVILIVGNLNKQTKTAKVKLNLKGMGFKSNRLQAKNVLNQTAVNISSSGILTVSVRGESFKLIHVSLK